MKFKWVSEYAICAVMATEIPLILMDRSILSVVIRWLLMVSIGSTIGSEPAFTLYQPAYGSVNIASNVMKITAFFSDLPCPHRQGSALEAPLHLGPLPVQPAERAKHASRPPRPTV